MSHLRRLRRFLAGGEEALKAGVFAAHRRQFDQSTILVRAFYGLLIFHLSKAFGRWNRWLDLEQIDGLWPLFWSDRFDAQFVVALILSTFALGSFMAMLSPQRRICRLMAFLGLFFSAALSNSFGKIDHGSHPWIYASFIFIFLPDGTPQTLARSIAARQRYLLVFAGAQASFLLTYSLAGFWKLYVGIQQALAGHVGVLSMDGFAYMTADRLLQTSSQSVLGPLVIVHPWLSGPLMLGAIYFEIFALVVVFRPSLRRLWGTIIVAFHLGTLLVLTVEFSTNIMLAAILLIAAPGPPRRPSARVVIANLPLVRLLWRCARPALARMTHELRSERP